MRLPLLVVAALCAMTAPASADPVFTLLFTTILPSIGVEATAIAFGTTTWVQLLSGIATVALGVGMMLLMPTPKPPDPSDGHTATQQAIPPVVYGFGRARVAGATVFRESRNSTLHQVQVLTGHKIIGFVEFWLNDDKVYPSEDHYVRTIIDGRYYASDRDASAVRIETRLGEDTETAYSKLVTESGGMWTSDARGDKCASLYMALASPPAEDFSRIFPYGACKVSATLDLVKVFDPRVSGQVWNDESTWTTDGYDNPALVLLFFECFSPFGAGRDYQTAILPVLDRWIEEANICDEEVPLKAGGTERRYRLGGWTDTERTDVRGTRQQILQSCDGFFVERGDGAILLWVGKYRAPTVEITDDDIVEWTWNSSLPESDRYERIVAKYCSTQNGYSTVDTDPVDLDNGALATSKNRTAPLELPWVQSTGQASRLLRREKSRYEEPVRGRIGMRLSGLNALYERWVLVNSSIPRLQGVVIENRGAQISLTEGKCGLDFISSGSHVDTYTAATDESSPPTTVLRVDGDGVPIPVILGATAEEIMIGDSTVVYIDVTIEAPTTDTGDIRTNLTFLLRWTLHGSSTSGSKSIPPSSYSIVSGAITLTTDTVVPSAVYDIDVASVSTTGSRSAWSTSTSVSTSVAGIAPASPVISSAVGGAGEATITAEAPNSPNVSALRFWKAASGDPFSSATDISGALYCSPNQSLPFTATVAAGTWSFWATAENYLGTASTPAGPATVTVT